MILAVWIISNGDEDNLQLFEGHAFHRYIHVKFLTYFWYKLQTFNELRMIASLWPSFSAVLNNVIPGDLVVAIKGDFYNRRSKIAETQRLKSRTRVVGFWDGDDHESIVPRAQIKKRSADDDQPMVQPDDESEDPSLSSQDEIADGYDSDGSIEDCRSAISGEDGSDPRLSSSEHNDDGDQTNCPVQTPVNLLASENYGGRGGRGRGGRGAEEGAVDAA